MSKNVPGFMILIVVLFAFAAPAQIVRTFVSTGGVDNATCSRTQPCRTFSAAMGAVSTGGEVVALDSGGYGPFTVTSSVSVIAPPSVHAAIAPTAGAAITVNAAAAHVILRGLYLNGQGASTGIAINLAAATHVENCVVSGFAGNGVASITENFTELYVNDSIIRNNAASGIYGTMTTEGFFFSTITVDGSKLERNAYGLAIDKAWAAVSNTIATGNLLSGFFCRGTGDTARMTLEKSVSTGNGVGIDVVNGTVTIHDSSFTHSLSVAASGPGVRLIGPNAVVDLEDSVSSNNGTSAVYVGPGTLTLSNNILRGGVENAGGTIYTRGNNTIRGSVNGALTPLDGQ